MTHWFGQAMFATTSLPPMLWPNLSRSSRLSTVAANSSTVDRYTVEVVKMAAIVPTGMLFCASRKSPERFEPAMIPAQKSET